MAELQDYVCVQTIQPPEGRAEPRRSSHSDGLRGQSVRVIIEQPEHVSYLPGWQDVTFCRSKSKSDSNDLSSTDRPLCGASGQ